MNRASELSKVCPNAVEVRDGVCVLPFGMAVCGMEAGSLESVRRERPDLFSGFGSVPENSDGIFVHIPDGTVAEYPLCIHLGGSGKSTVVVAAGEGSSAELIFIFSGSVAVERMVGVGKSAALRIKEMVVSDSGLTALSSVTSLREGATANTVTVDLGEGETAMEYKIALEGRRSEAVHAGLFMAADGERKAVKVRVEHLVPDCRSDVLVKGVASGTGVGSFDGMVYVAQDAQHTEAYQQSRNLIMGGQARIVTSPQLEIYADDVKCSHGATVGQMNDDAVYYMRQRGLGEQEARGLQLTGFVNDVISRLGEGPLAETVLAEAGKKIERLQQTA